MGTIWNTANSFIVSVVAGAGIVYAIVQYVLGTLTLRRLRREDEAALEELARLRKPDA